MRLTPFDVVVPDNFFLRKEPVNIYGEQFVDGPPDLIVEVPSPSTRLRDMNSKRELYARTGVAEYCVVDSIQAAVVVHELTPEGTYIARPSDGTRVTSSVLAGIEISMEELFGGD